MTYSVKPFPSELIDTGTKALRIGSDWAVSEVDGLIYGVDLTGNGFQTNLFGGGVETEPTTPKLYAYDPNANSVTTTNLNFNGAKAPNYWTGAVATDDLNHFTLQGDHDTNGNGDYDLNNKVGMYRINLITGDAFFVIPSEYNNVNFHDGAGCIASVDKGDAPSSYGEVGHRNEDVDQSGTPDLILGNKWDPDLYYFYSDDATGDNNTGENDEEGVNMPADIIVSTSTVIPVTVTGGSGYLNVFADLDNDGVFTGTGERILDDYSVVSGLNNVSVVLNAAYTSGYNGDTFIRFRLCDTADICDSPLGTVANGEVEDYQFNLINQIVLEGTVFEDNGQGSVTAHDGKQEGMERGLDNFIVRAIYNETTPTAGYNLGQEIIRTTTGGNGDYTLVIPVELADKDILLEVISKAAWIDISESDVTSLGQVTNSSSIDSQMLINASAGDYLSNLDFGKVTVPTLEPDNFTETEPGMPVVFSHRFNVNTSGDVSFSISNVEDIPLGYSWSHILYRDENCNGEIDQGVDDNIVNPVSMSADALTEVCLLVKIIVPNNAPFNAQYQYHINADMDFSNTTFTRQIENTDMVKVSVAGAGELEIEKTVTNITQGGSEEVSNQARPGDVLEYKVKFINGGVGTIISVHLFDVIPAFTTLYEVIDCISSVSLPVGITCNILTPDGFNNIGYDGGIEWELNGSLESGDGGYVTYKVKIQ